MPLLALALALPTVVGEGGDGFGAALAGGHDLDGDGLADLAVGAPGATGGGAVWVFSADNDAGFGVGNAARASAAGDELGAALVAGDADGDGLAELYAGAPGNDGAVYRHDVTTSGPGTPTASWAGSSGAGSEFGTALLLADLDGDGYGELVVGAPAGAGSVYVYAGSATGPAAGAATTLAGATAGDAFGTALAAGDYDGDGLVDLAVAAPGVDTTYGNDGVAYVFAGSTGGVSETASTLVESGGWGWGFGSWLAAGDYDGDGYADLAVAAREATDHRIDVFLGSVSGLVATPVWDAGVGEKPGDAALATLPDPLGDGADALLVGAQADYDAYWCECTSGAVNALVTGGALATELARVELDGSAAATSLGDLDGDGLPDAAYGGGDTVTVLLLAEDVDLDGFPPSGTTRPADCDDTDATVNPGALEVDGDGVDQDCDGADEVPASTVMPSCPTFSTPAEAWPLTQEPDAFVPDLASAAEEVVDAIAAEGGESRTPLVLDACDDDDQLVTANALGTWTREARAWTEWTEFGIACSTNDVRVEEGVLAASLTAPTAAGALGAGGERSTSSHDGDNDSGSWGGSSGAFSGWIRWADGTVGAGSATWSTSWSHGDCITRSTSLAREVDGCTLVVEEDLGSCHASTTTWRVETDAAALMVMSPPSGACRWATGDSAYAWAELDGTGTLVYADGWGAVTDLELDADGDGWTEAAGDCDDADPSTWPCADLDEGDGVDHDCDGVAAVDTDGDGAIDSRDCAPSDPACSSCEAGWFIDADADGIGGEAVEGCTVAPGWVAEGGDCDDDDATVFPGAAEHCDARDEDCDGTVDEEPVDPTDWIPDADADGYGARGGGARAACAPDPGEADNAEDCDDADPTVNPAATELPGDGIDQDCDGSDAAAAGRTPSCGCAASTGRGGAAGLLLLGFAAARAGRRRPQGGGRDGRGAPPRDATDCAGR